MTAFRRPLAGCIVGISISESDDSADRGFPVWQVNRITLQLVAALFGQGASVIFGHDWREDGVMEAVHAFAMQIQAPVPLSATEARVAGEPLLRNILPWPDEPRLSSQDLDRLGATLRVQPGELPLALHAIDGEARKADPNSALYQYVRARGLTFLRHRLSAAAHARVCMGGRQSNFLGRYPGIVEEALFALRERRPLYITGMFGGAAQHVIEAIEGEEMPETFCPFVPVHHFYERPPIKETDPDTGGDRFVDRDAVWSTFKAAGVPGIVQANKLTVEENNELFHTLVFDRVIQLLLTGLSRLEVETPRGNSRSE